MFDIYIGFSTRTNGICCADLLDFVDVLIYWFSGPFTHCHLLLDSNKMCNRVNINKKCNKVLYGQSDYTKKQAGFTYIKIPVTPKEYQELKKIMEEIVAHQTHFDLAECMGFKSYPYVVTRQKKAWFCSSLITYLLKEIGVLPRNINPIKLSVTSLYLLLRSSSTPSRKIELMKTNPITKAETLSCDDVYCDYMNIEAYEIPVLNIQNFKGQ